jgi:hypothetical protein
VTPRRLVLVGALLTLLGSSVAATAPVLGTVEIKRVEGRQTVGGVVAILGWALLAWGIHRLGRESGAGREG